MIYSKPELLEEYRRKERERSGVRKVIESLLSVAVTLHYVIYHVRIIY